MSNSELTPDQWFTEAFGDEGSAFSLKIKAKLHSEKSEYQQLDIYDTERFGKLMVLDGCTMVSSRENFLYHEMMSHPAMFTHPEPKKVVIIGGGDCGTLKEVLKHQGVQEAWQVEIDERVTRLAEEYFPELCESNNDPRANFYFGDGIQWIKDAEANSIDVIIIDSTDPVGPAEGLFAVEFYQHCFAALKDNGILVQQSESPLYHTDSIIKKIHEDFAETGFESSHTFTFPQPIYPSGWWSCSMASKGGNVREFREQDSANKSFETQYYNVMMHFAGFAMPEFMRKQLADV